MQNQIYISLTYNKSSWIHFYGYGNISTLLLSPLKIHLLKYKGAG